MSSCIRLPLNPSDSICQGIVIPLQKAYCFIKLCRKNTEIRLTGTDRHGSDADGRLARWRRGAKNKAIRRLWRIHLSVFFSAPFWVWPCLFKVTIAVFRDICVNVRKLVAKIVTLLKSPEYISVLTRTLTTSTQPNALPFKVYSGYLIRTHMHTRMFQPCSVSVLFLSRRYYQSKNLFVLVYLLIIPSHKSQRDCLLLLQLP